MINREDLARLKNCAELTWYLQHYFSRLNMNFKLDWELRSDKQFVSDCFSKNECYHYQDFASALNQSGMFTEVKIVRSRQEEDQFRILVKTDSVLNLLEQFRLANYFNALLRVFPISGAVCLPSALNEQLHIKARNSTYNHTNLIQVLKILGISYSILPCSALTISCVEVSSLIHHQKQLCLDYLKETIMKIEPGIKIFQTKLNVTELNSGKFDVKMSVSENVWETVPAISFYFKTSPFTLASLKQIHSTHVEFKVSGYFMDEDKETPCGIKPKKLLDIPFIIKDILWATIQKSRSNYYDTLLTFKSKESHYGFSNLPFDISKEILSLACDDSALFSEDEKKSSIDRISEYRLG